MACIRKASVFCFLLVVILGINISIGRAGKAEELCHTTGMSNYAVQLSLSDYPYVVCGGSLIKPRWVLTAASCLLKGRITEMKVLAEYRFGDIYDTRDKKDQKYTNDESKTKKRDKRLREQGEEYLRDLEGTDYDEGDVEVRTTTSESLGAGEEYYYYAETDKLDDDDEGDEEKPKRKKKMEKNERKIWKAIQTEMNATVGKRINMKKILAVVSKVEEAFIHPMYNIPFESYNDVALLRLEEQILVPRRQYAILPIEPVEDFDYQCPKVVMARWRSDTRTLQCEELQVRDRKDCGWPSSNLVFKNIFCAEFTEHTGQHLVTDESDSGGPVLCNNAQYGIVPYNFYCKRPEVFTHNCLYTRVDRMLEFIKESMQEYRSSCDRIHRTMSILFILLVIIQNIY